MERTLPDSDTGPSYAAPDGWERAALSARHIFPPFRVNDCEPLGNAWREGRLRPDTPLLLTELPPEPVALITTQMAYHHVAQGVIASKAWMVSF